MNRMIEVANIIIGSGSNSKSMPAFAWYEIFNQALAGAMVDPSFPYIHFIPAEMLPPGFWPKGELTGNHTEPGITPFDIPERFRFLRSLGPTREVIGLVNGREYRGFVVKDVVVVDCPTYGNAVYMFKEHENWEYLMGLTKLDILTGNYPAFIGRLYHTGEWQERVVQIINQNSTG